MITNYNYKQKLIETRNLLSETNEKFVDLKSNNKIDRLALISLGNSISTGFSFCDSVEPFIVRNDELYRSRSLTNIEFYSYAMPVFNSEIKVIEWYTKNISHREINRLAESSISDLRKDLSHVSDYSSLAKENNIGLRTLNSEKINKIIIYNGVTGTLMDSLFNGGNIKNILHCFRTDLHDLQILLKYILADSRTTQIYICGLPSYFGIKIEEFVNRRIKEICDQFINVNYVPSQTHNMLFTRNKRRGLFDAHFNDAEYMQLYYKILNEINRKYVPTQIVLDINDYIINNHIGRCELGSSVDAISEKYESSLKNLDYASLMLKLNMLNSKYLNRSLSVGIERLKEKVNKS